MVSPQNDNSGPLSGLPTFLPSPLYSLSPAHSQMNLLIPKSEQVMLCTKTSSGSQCTQSENQNPQGGLQDPTLWKDPHLPTPYLSAFISYSLHWLLTYPAPATLTLFLEQARPASTCHTSAPELCICSSFCGHAVLSPSYSHSFPLTSCKALLSCHSLREALPD